MGVDGGRVRRRRDIRRASHKVVTADCDVSVDDFVWHDSRSPLFHRRIASGPQPSVDVGRKEADSDRVQN